MSMEVGFVKAAETGHAREAADCLEGQKFLNNEHDGRWAGAPISIHMSIHHNVPFPPFCTFQDDNRTRQAVHNWRTRGVPRNWQAPVSRATRGAVTVSQMRAEK